MEPSRETILNKIRSSIEKREKSAHHEPDFSTPDRRELKGSLLETFVDEFEENLGYAFVCSDSTDLFRRLKVFLKENEISNLHCIDPELKTQLGQAEISFSSVEVDFDKMEAGLTSCEFLIARFGSIMVSSAQASGRAMNVFPPTHIVLANQSQLVAEIENALEGISKKYGDSLPSMISTITGPSRTADIEKTLVMGAHGPKKLAIFINKSN